jgi:hypothetical protein
LSDWTLESDRKRRKKNPQIPYKIFSIIWLLQVQKLGGGKKTVINFEIVICLDAIKNTPRLFVCFSLHQDKKHLSGLVNQQQQQQQQ